ncbi:TraR/DksA C4-type zinc finger protein, partial [bacterium]|nr:TraR/DksA C4-type zinc finger protein [bacterium]MBC7320546.1 TraR/DksA C4-type zinc finger protein [bacterium]
TATEEEKERFNKIRQERIEYLLNAKEEDIADIRWIDIEEPERARIFNSLQCEVCGEFFMETKGRIQDGKIVCMECFRYKE